MATYPFEKHEFYLPDDVLLEDFATIPKKYPSKPTTSIGNGEVAYMEDEDEVYVNKGTADTPNWQLMGGSGVTVCTSTTKPESPDEGMLIYVTDNESGKELEHYNGSSWETINDNTDSVSNPMTSDLDTGGYKIYNDSGAVTFESSTGVFTFQKSS